MNVLTADCMSVTITSNVRLIVTDSGVELLATHRATSVGMMAAGHVCGAARFIAIFSVNGLCFAIYFQPPNEPI